jgi:predicted Rossmann-fold nucleotide-binding protein
MQQRLEIKDMNEFWAWVGLDPRPAADFVNLNLIGHNKYFKNDVIGQCGFINCQLGKHLSKRAARFASVVIMAPQNELFSIFPSKMSTPWELYDSYQEDVDWWENSRDRKIYNWFMQDKRVVQTSASALIQTRCHDSGLERAIANFIVNHVGEHDMPPIAIMGGHNISRISTAYWEVVKLARALARRHHLIITGGGPGLMEAGNLGALLAPFPDEKIEEIVPILCVQNAQDFKGNPKPWFEAAKKVLDNLFGDWKNPPHRDSLSLGIPTYLYGHEPSNIFATHIAKFFHNSLREDGLVTLADGGIIFAQGNAGTVQEIFQDACQNYYANNEFAPTPMVLFNSSKNYWNNDATKMGDKERKTKALKPLLTQLASEQGGGKDFLDALLFSDNIEEILAFFKNYHDANIDKATLGQYWRLSLNGHALGDPVF